jgi:hypothetical protein
MGGGRFFASGIGDNSGPGDISLIKSRNQIFQVKLCGG